MDPGEFASHAQLPAFLAVLTYYGGTITDLIAGVNLFSDIKSGDVAAFSQFFQLVGQTQDARDAVASFQAGQFGNGMKALARVVITEDFAEASSRYAQHKGNGIISRAVAAKVGAYLRWISLGLAVVQGAFDIHSLETCQPVERYLGFQGLTTTGPPFRVTLNWNQANDIDLHVFTSDGQHSFYANKVIEGGSLVLDDIDGFGPENFTLTTLRPGRYYVAVNYYQGQPATDSTIVIRTKTETRALGPHVLSTENLNAGYPVRGDTASWWRVCDLNVSASGATTILPPNTSIGLDRGRAVEPLVKK